MNKHPSRTPFGMGVPMERRCLAYICAPPMPKRSSTACRATLHLAIASVFNDAC